MKVKVKAEHLYPAPVDGLSGIGLFRKSIEDATLPDGYVVGDWLYEESCTNKERGNFDRVTIRWTTVDVSGHFAEYRHACCLSEHVEEVS